MPDVTPSAASSPPALSASSSARGKIGYDSTSAGATPCWLGTSSTGSGGLRSIPKAMDWSTVSLPSASSIAMRSW